MATFNQQGQHVHSQVNSDFADLRGATLGTVSPDVTRTAPEDLRAALRAVRRAGDSGLVDAGVADAVSFEIEEALLDLGKNDPPSASARVRKAVGFLQAAAPVAAIAGTLATVWGSISGGA